MNFTPEQLAKAKAAKSAEALLAYAGEIDYKLTEEEAKQYFDLWHKEGVLADEELENVSGGSTCIGGSYYSDDPDGYLITTSLNYCTEFKKWNEDADGYCRTCAWVDTSCGLVTYCRHRTRFHDALNSKIGNGFNGQ